MDILVSVVGGHKHLIYSPTSTAPFSHCSPSSSCIYLFLIPRLPPPPAASTYLPLPQPSLSRLTAMGQNSFFVQKLNHNITFRQPVRYSDNCTWVPNWVFLKFHFFSFLFFTVLVSAVLCCAISVCTKPLLMSAQRFYDHKASHH